MLSNARRAILRQERGAMEQYTLRYQTDTAHPQQIIPIYVIHTLERPFCQFPDCQCHTNQEEIAKLLEFVNNGLMTIREAADFVNGKTAV